MAKLCEILKGLLPKYLHDIDQKVEVNKHKDKPLRFNIWEITQAHVADMFGKGGLAKIPKEGNSPQVLKKIENALKRVESNTEREAAADFFDSVISDPENIAMSVALHEIVESVKGEADKAQNLGIDVVSVANETLPVVPMSRVAASIGRKLVYQMGHRFKSQEENRSTSEEIEALYYGAGKLALERLSQAGYVDLHSNLPSIKDYINKDELKLDYVESNVKTVKGKHVLTVSLNEEAMGIADGNTISYFTNRSEADISNTKLGVITSALGAIRQVTQPSTIVAPDTSVRLTPEDLLDLDNNYLTPDPVTDSARQKLYENPLYVNTPVHGLMGLLNKRVLDSGESGSDIVKKLFGKKNSGLIESLFGIKRSDAHSKDKKESIAGQNLSKTTPFNDLAENYGIIQGSEKDPAALHLPMKQGRNVRLYYHNSILNPHGSKHSRYSLTSGSYDVPVDSDSFKKLIFAIGDTFGTDAFSYDALVGKEKSNMDGALTSFDTYSEAVVDSDLDLAIGELSKLARVFPGVNYASILTGLQAVKDIRSPKDGKVTTEFMTSADATASGGTQTFMQAAGTNLKIVKFLEGLGMLTGKDGKVKVRINDLYGIMEKSINDFIEGKSIPYLVGQDLTQGKDVKLTGERLLMSKTVDLLFDKGKKLRNLAKDPTMVFVYKQGETGAIGTMSNNLADRIIDNLESADVREYLVELFDNVDYRTASTAVLNDRTGLYKDIVNKIKESGLPEQLHGILEASIEKQFLSSYNAQGNKVWKFAEALGNNFKILPAGAILAGIKPTKANLKKYGMPISKIHEVAHQVPDTNDTVLTQEQKVSKAVADVSTVHGIDSAQLYHALDRVLARPEFKGQGAVVVHDEVRGSVELVEAVTAEYREVTKDITGRYDIHQQIMHAVAVYSPETAQDPAFQVLAEEISGQVETKKKIIKEQFNNETSALIGDGDAYRKFSKDDETAEKGTKTPKEADQKEKDNIPEDSLSLLKELASESPMIQKFLNMANASKVNTANANEFIAADDVITISGTDQGRKVGDKPRKLDMTKPADRKLQKELIEHEITHANTVAYISKAIGNPNTPEGREIRYFKKVLAKLTDNRTKQDMAGQVSGETLSRVDYMTTRKSDAENVAEFVAIMNSEPETAAEIYGYLNSAPSLAKRIADFVAKVAKSFLSISEEDLAKDIDIEKLYNALMNVTVTGETQRDQGTAELEKYLPAFERLGAGPVASARAKAEAIGKIHYMNYAVASMLNSKFESGGKKLLGSLDQLMTKFPMYVDVMEKMSGIYAKSEDLQQLIHTITGTGIDKVKKANVLAKMQAVMSNQTAVINDQMGKFNEQLGKLSAEEKKIVGRFVTDMPLHDYFTLASDITTEAAVAAEVVRLEKEVRKAAPAALKDVNDLISWNVKGEDPKGDLYNLEARYNEGELGIKVKKLLALKSIEAIGSKNFVKFLENTDLSDLVKDTVMANRISLLDVKGESKLRDSMVMDYYKDDIIIEAIELNELSRYEAGENTGWVVLKKPQKGELGIVYKKTIDSSSIAGAYTDTKLNSTDIDIIGSKEKYNGVVLTTDGHKLRLTREQKLAMGLVEDFSQGLVRGAAHNMAIQESQSIRDTMLRKDSRIIVGKDFSKLSDIVSSKNVDNPWFVKLDDDVNYSDLPANIRAKYKKVKGRASDVKGDEGTAFNEEVDLVRKDISHWLLGGSSSSLFQNPQYKWAVRITKDLVAGAKIGMVVLNPLKIARDNISNVSYLSVMGLSPLFIAENYKNITRDFQSYTDIQRQIVQLKVKLVARPDSSSAKSKLASLQARLKKNPLGDIGEKGFVNSLGSDLVAKNADTLSGLQADMHSALEYLLLKKDGKKNIVSHFIMQLQKLGFEGEDFLKYIGNTAKKIGKPGKGVKTELDQVYNRLKEIRTDDDIINYVSQYTTSPGSEAVRLGAAMTDLTDVLAKETLYRHLVETENMSESDARIKVLDSFPDYKENMPLAVKQLSDLGIIMFPSFWLRIQKVIYRMARDKPVNMATELMLQEALDSDIETILGSNIVNKSISFGGILHAPSEAVGVGSVIPMHIW